MPDDLTVAEVKDVDLLEVDVTASGRYRLVECAITEADEGACVTTLHAQADPDLAVVANRRGDGETQIGEGEPHPGARGENAGRTQQSACLWGHGCFTVTEVRVHHLGSQFGVSGLEDSEESVGQFYGIHAQCFAPFQGLHEDGDGASRWRAVAPGRGRRGEAWNGKGRLCGPP